MNILVIAPHPDDEVLGCGGTIAKYASQGHEVYVAVVTRGWEPLFTEIDTIKTREDCKKSDEYLGVKETIFMDFPSVKLETIPRVEFNEAFLNIVRQIKPNIVFLPYRGDMQLDHKMVVDAAMVALRPKYQTVIKAIYCYETLSETGWDVPNTTNEFMPNVYEDISNYLDIKLSALKMFSVQIEEFPNTRSLETVRALAMYRGSMVNCMAAEAFSLVREIHS